MSPRCLLLVSVIGLAGCADQRAEHVWSLDLEPNENGAYALAVPFLVHPGDDPEGADPALDALREQVQVMSGDATFTWSQNATVLIVEAQGPAMLEARHGFGGPVEQRESFLQWTLPHAEVARADGGGLPVHVTWQIDLLSAGGAHRCQAAAVLEADVPAQGPAPLGSGHGGEHWGGECS